MKPDRVGKCHSCNRSVYLLQNGETPSDEYLPAGDWDWVCYPCEFSLMKNDKYRAYKDNQYELHQGGKCNH